MNNRLKQFFRETPATDDNGRAPESHVKKVILIGFLSVVTVVIAYAGVLVWLTWPVSELSIGTSGTFGDSFGALNAMFTGLGFMGLLVTILLQREDLKITRKGLSETRQEIKTQSTTFQQQQFEDSFYRLLALYKENLSTLSANEPIPNSEKIYGVEVLSAVLARFNNMCKQMNHKFPDNLEEQEEYIYSLFRACRIVFRPQDRYVKTFIALLAMVENDSPTPERKESYLAILSSQLTIYELKYFFYQSFIMTDAAPIRALWQFSPSFGHRLASAGLAKGHSKSFEFYWGFLLPIRYSKSSPVAKDKMKALGDRVHKRRRLLSKKHLAEVSQVEAEKLVHTPDLQTLS